MKPMSSLLAVHRTFEKEGDGKRAVTWYIHDGENTVRCSPKKLVKFVSEVPAGTTMRFTQVNALDVQLTQLIDRGVIIVYAHWHDTGIAKGLEPSAIAEAFYKVPETVFRPFQPRLDIAELRDVLALRNALHDNFNDAVRRIRQVGRNRAEPEIKESVELKAAFDFLKKINAAFKIENLKGRFVSYDTKVDEVAKGIPECVLFNSIAGFEAYGTAAAVVSAAGGIDRFPKVSSFWHYFGQHNIDGRAAKRKTGTPCTWSRKGRTALYNMMDAIEKIKTNPWNPILESIAEEERALHETKHPGCKSPRGHSKNMAKRKVQKEILKRFFLACKMEKFVGGHRPEAPKLIAKAAQI